MLSELKCFLSTREIRGVKFLKFSFGTHNVPFHDVLSPQQLPFMQRADANAGNARIFFLFKLSFMSSALNSQLYSSKFVLLLRLNSYIWLPTTIIPMDTMHITHIVTIASGSNCSRIKITRNIIGMQNNMATLTICVYAAYCFS